MLEQKVSCSPHPFLQLGQRVRIRGGSLDGVEGILVGCDSASKLVISIELIQRSLAVSVYNFDVEPIGSCSGENRRRFENGVAARLQREECCEHNRANQDRSVAAAQE